MHNSLKSKCTFSALIFKENCRKHQKIEFSQDIDILVMKFLTRSFVHMCVFVFVSSMRSYVHVYVDKAMFTLSYTLF